MTCPPRARWSSPGSVCALQARSVASNTAPSRLEAVSAVGVGTRAHPVLAGRREGGDVVAQASGLVPQLLGPVGAQPRLELLETIGMGDHVGERDLMRPPRPLEKHAVDLVRAGPSL